MVCNLAFLFVVSWDTLEEQVVRECLGTPVIAFKPSRLMFSSHLDNTVNPSVPCDGKWRLHFIRNLFMCAIVVYVSSFVTFSEPFYVELPFMNPLKIPLSIRNITLKFDQSKTVDVNTVVQLELESEEVKTV